MLCVYVVCACCVCMLCVHVVCMLCVCCVYMFYVVCTHWSKIPFKFQITPTHQDSSLPQAYTAHQLITLCYKKGWVSQQNFYKEPVISFWDFLNLRILWYLRKMNIKIWTLQVCSIRPIYFSLLCFETFGWKFVQSNSCVRAIQDTIEVIYFVCHFSRLVLWVFSIIIFSLYHNRSAVSKGACYFVHVLGDVFQIKRYL